MGALQMAKADLPAARHHWVKLRVHVYVCRVCGCGRVNGQRPSGEWIATWHLPTGESLVQLHRPPCERGPLTDRYLKKYETAIACWPHA